MQKNSERVSEALYTIIPPMGYRVVVVIVVVVICIADSMVDWFFEGVKIIIKSIKKVSLCKGDLEGLFDEVFRLYKKSPQPPLRKGAFVCVLVFISTSWV